MTDDEVDLCQINYNKTLTVEEQDKRFVLVISNALCEDDCKRIFGFSSNLTSYDFDLKNNEDISGYLAFQGFAYFDDWGNDCPLESVSRITPFQFTDLNQVLVLRSTYAPSKMRDQSCLWQFKAPKNYGFKIVISEFNIPNSTIFKVENTQDTIIT
uniref:CUB domain-containing protein n=1 Tax=Panagrolaimus sp. ES5 TaxID=591445 RepID=A0AC34FF52_9BILA